MSTSNLLGIDHVKPEDVDAYKQNYGAHDVGKELKDVVEYYNKWAQDGTYEQVLCPGRYNGPDIAARVVERYFGDRKNDTYIIDVAAGTGLVGEKLRERGFTRMDALEPSEAMLDVASAKKIYTKCIYGYLNMTNVENDIYDVLVVAGGMGEGHIPTVDLAEMVRVVKPGLLAGGCVCIVMREEYLSYVAEYVDRLEPFMQQLVEQGAWTQEERTVVPKYSFGKNGVVFVYRVYRPGAPPISSLTP
ncbi:hypothetical protein LSAT2_021147 [Lamellibrachia satsuma]|nr:hypothetical protein LSAT2_021147 [Lamellibrachia satsuma]